MSKIFASVLNVGYNFFITGKSNLIILCPIISFALDLDNGKLFLAKNGAYKNQSGATGDPVNGTNPTFTISDTTKTYGFYTEMRGNDNNGTIMNLGNGYFGTTAVSSAQNPDDGNGIFEYDPPSGFRALCTKSINAQEYS